MIAEVISVGTELLLGQTIDTDAAAVAQALSRQGISIYHRSTVGDNIDRLTAELKQALERADIVITIGGLGPTMDDLTKETLASVLEIPLVTDPAHVQRLTEMGKRRGWDKFPEHFMKQADIPASGRGIPNNNGTALGAIFEKDGKYGICLPGPPNELIPMLEETVEPFFAEKTSGERAVIKSRVLRIIGMGESTVEEKVKDLMEDSNPTVAPYAKTGEVHLRVTARASTDEAAMALISPRESAIRERLGDVIYGIDSESLEYAVVTLLQQSSRTVACAESCSGGLISKRITDIPDSSRVFGLGIVSYSNESKEKFLGVDSDLLAKHGAVSHEVARAMAEGVRVAAGADIGVSVTGIAGPSGGSEKKPVGTVYIGLAWDGGVSSQHHQFLGRRQDVSQRAAQAALALVRRWLIAPGDSTFKFSP